MKNEHSFPPNPISTPSPSSGATLLPGFRCFLPEITMRIQTQPYTYHYQKCSSISTTTIDTIVYASILHCSGTCVRQTPKSWITQLKDMDRPIRIIMDKLLFTEVELTYTPTSNVRVPVSHILTNTVSYQTLNLYQYDRWTNGMPCSQFIL